MMLSMPWGINEDISNESFLKAISLILCLTPARLQLCVWLRVRLKFLVSTSTNSNYLSDHGPDSNLDSDSQLQRHIWFLIKLIQLHHIQLIFIHFSNLSFICIMLNSILQHVIQFHNISSSYKSIILRNIDTWIIQKFLTGENKWQSRK